MRSRQRPLQQIILPFAALLIGGPWLRGAAGNVQVEKKPAVIEHKTFDPKHPPAEMPPLKGDEAAVTQALFNCAVNSTYRVVDRKRNGERCSVTAQISSVQIAIELKIIIWLPEHAPAKLTAHEEGHRRISERVYQSAEEVARAAARKLDGQRVSGEGDDCAAAEKRTIETAATELCQAYLDATGGVSERIGDLYDELTAHGTKARPSEDDAIRQAFERDEKRSKADGGKGEKKD